jgi:hypothetical protein
MYTFCSQFLLLLVCTHSLPYTFACFACFEFLPFTSRMYTFCSRFLVLGCVQHTSPLTLLVLLRRALGLRTTPARLRLGGKNISQSDFQTPWHLRFMGRMCTTFAIFTIFHFSIGFAYVYDLKSMRLVRAVWTWCGHAERLDFDNSHAVQ